MAEVTDRLRSDILEGRFLPGTRLIELHLSERYGVGRAAIRTAIVELSAEGLVVHEINRGATVRRVPVEVAIEIAEARAVLEGLIARRAAERATDEDRSELEGVIADMEVAVADDDQATYSKLNDVLHSRIREISGHSIAGELTVNLRRRGAQQEFQLSLLPGRSSVSLPQHREIVAGIVHGDGAAAERAMHAHLASVQEALRRWTP